MLSLFILKSSVLLISFPFSTSQYSRLPSPNVIPIRKCSHNVCFFVMIILLAYNFRSSTKKLWVMSLVLSIPYEYPLMGKYTLQEFDGMRCYCFVFAHPMKQCAPLNVTCFMALINCFGSLASFKACISFSCGTESNASL